MFAYRSRFLNINRSYREYQLMSFIIKFIGLDQKQRRMARLAEPLLRVINLIMKNQYYYFLFSIYHASVEYFKQLKT